MSDSPECRRIPAVDYEASDWTVEREIETEGEVSVGDTVRFSKPIGEGDVRTFAEASGDTNRLHLDDEFADGTRFGDRIAHGTLVSGLISAALARLPGVTIYLSQETEFDAAVEIGDRPTAEVEVLEDLGGGRFRLRTEVFGEDGKPVVTGEAVVLVDDLPDE